MSTPSEIKGFFDECERLAAQSREIREVYAAMRAEALKKNIDWSQLKSLATAHDADKHDAKCGHKVARLIRKADNASWYAEILNLREDEQVIESCSSGKQSKAGEATAVDPVAGEAERATVPRPRQLSRGETPGPAIKPTAVDRTSPVAGVGEPAPSNGGSRALSDLDGAGLSISETAADELAPSAVSDGEAASFPVSPHPRDAASLSDSLDRPAIDCSSRETIRSTAVESEGIPDFLRRPLETTGVPS